MADGFLESLPCPALTKSNYVSWEIRMKVFLQAHDLWDAIEDDAKGPVDPSTDRLALAAIYQAISTDALFKIARKKTAKEAWLALRTMGLGTEPVMKARARAFTRELEAVVMKEAESVDDFVARVTALVFNIRAHGGEVEESYIVRKLLWGASPKFSDLTLMIKVLCDLKSMTVDDLVDRLKAHEIRLQDSLMTHAEWKAEMKKRGEQGCGGDGFKGNGRGSGCGDGERSNDTGKKKKGQKFDKSKVRCYNCRDYGHFASECRNPKK